MIPAVAIVDVAVVVSGTTIVVTSEEAKIPRAGVD